METVTDADIKAQPNHWAVTNLIATNLFTDHLIGHVKQFDANLSNACNGQYELVMPLGFEIVEPMVFPARNAAPVQGAWGYQFKVRRCDTTISFRSIAFVGQDARINVMPLVPGASRADARLLVDVMQNLKMSAEVFYAARSEGKRCGWYQVLNTNVTAQSEGASWQERWPTLVCDKIFLFDVTFTPTPDIGGTGFKISLGSDGPS